MARNNCPISSGRDKKLLANGSCANIPSTAPTCSCLALLPLPHLPPPLPLPKEEGREMGDPRFSQDENPILSSIPACALCTKGLEGSGVHSEEQLPLIPSLCPSPAQPQIDVFFSILSSILPRPQGWLHSALSAFLPCSRECVSWMA